MDKDLLEFMKARFPAGNRIKIDHAADESIIGKSFLINSVEADGLHCTDESGSPVLIDPDQATFYKIDQPPVVAYGYSEEPAELTDVRQIAEFIMRNGMDGDISMYDKASGEFVLNTMGIFIDRIADMDFRSELITILVPLQKEYPFGMPNEQTDNGCRKEFVLNEDRLTFNYNETGTRVYFDISTYAEPSVLAITLMRTDCEPYATLSVNLAHDMNLKPNQTFIDTNNPPGAEKFLASINGIRPVTENGSPVMVQSGYCKYPLYEFDEDLLRQLDKIGYEEHLARWSKETDLAEEDKVDRLVRSMLEEQYPSGARIKLYSPEDRSKVQEVYTVDHIDDEFCLCCVDSHGNNVVIDPDLTLPYKIDCEPIIGYAGEKTQELANVVEVARFIVENGIDTDMEFYTKDGAFVLNTCGPFLDNIGDSYRRELIGILTDMQQYGDVSCEETETEDMEMGGLS